jgi:hypothetical protein
MYTTLPIRNKDGDHLMLNLCRESQGYLFIQIVHDPFSQNMVLIFYMSSPYLFALKIRCYALSQDKWSMFYIIP